MIFEDLVAFVRIADLSSVSAAARSLQAPKSSVSRALSRLESRVGAELVGRSQRRLRLTDAGELLYQRALRILADVRDAESAMEALFVEPRGLVRVCAPHTFAHGVIAPMLPGFLRRYPDVQIAIDSDNRTFDAVPEGVDLVIHRGPAADPALVARRLPSVNLWVCASPAYLRERGTPATVHDLYAHDIVDRETASTWVFEVDRRELTFRARARAIASDATASLGILEHGFGVGRLPDYLACAAVARGGLQRILSDHVARPKIDIVALHPSHGSFSARVRVFLDALAAHMASDAKHVA